MDDKKLVATYAAYSKNKVLRMESSSGAIFTHLAEHIIAAAGVVYGVAMSSDCMSAEFIRVDNAEKLAKLRGSKYMQAVVGNTFVSVRDDLKSGIKVLFSGTGCQVNGLKSFLGKDYSNLICVDVICHGTPSQKLWEEYVLSINEKYNSKVVSVNFRNKKYGWSDFGIARVDSTHKELYKSKEKDPYMLMFLRDYSLRPSCYECHAKNIKCADITLADFWGVNKVIPEFSDGLGISLIIARTEKGQSLFAIISDQIKVKEITYEQGIIGNPAEYKSAKRPVERDSFYLDMNSLSFEDLAIKYATPDKESAKTKIKRLVKQFIMIMTNGRKLGGGYQDKVAILMEFSPH